MRQNQSNASASFSFALRCARHSSILGFLIFSSISDMRRNIERKSRAQHEKNNIVKPTAEVKLSIFTQKYTVRTSLRAAALFFLVFFSIRRVTLKFCGYVRTAHEVSIDFTGVSMDIDLDSPGRMENKAPSAFQKASLRGKSMVSGIDQGVYPTSID